MSYDRRNVTAAQDFFPQKLEVLIESVEKEVKQMKSSLALYKKDPGKYLPQLDNLANAASSAASSLSVMTRLVDKNK